MHAGVGVLDLRFEFSDLRLDLALGMKDLNASVSFALNTGRWKDRNTFGVAAPTEDIGFCHRCFYYSLGVFAGTTEFMLRTENLLPRTRSERSDDITLTF